MRCKVAGGGQTNSCEFTVEIFIPFPTLVIRRSNSPKEIVLGWAKACGEFIVEETPTLGSPADWRRSSLPIDGQGDFFEMTVPIQTQQRFFRLISQPPQ